MRRLLWRSLNTLRKSNVFSMLCFDVQVVIHWAIVGEAFVS